MYFRFLLGFIIAAILSGCITQADQQQQAEQILNKLHTAIQQQQWDTATKLFNPEFFKTEPKTHWQNHLKEIQNSLGKMTAFSIVSQTKDPRFAGDFYIYIVSVKHEHGFSHETVTIFKSLDDQPMMVSGYQIKAQANQ